MGKLKEVKYKSSLFTFLGIFIVGVIILLFGMYAKVGIGYYNSMTGFEFQVDTSLSDVINVSNTLLGGHANIFNMMSTLNLGIYIGSISKIGSFMHAIGEGLSSVKVMEIVAISGFVVIILSILTSLFILGITNRNILRK